VNPAIIELQFFIKVSNVPPLSAQGSVYVARVLLRKTAFRVPFVALAGNKQPIAGSAGAWTQGCPWSAQEGETGKSMMLIALLKDGMHRVEIGSDWL
jgi:hypothetical protein